MKPSMMVIRSFFLDEGHLQVDLGELGLAVRPEVLVAEALDDLVITVETPTPSEAA